MGQTDYDIVQASGGFKVGSTTVINSDGEITADIKDTLAQGSIYVGDASNETSELDAKGSGKILVGNGTTITSVSVSGDATLSSAGALSLAAGSVAAAELATAVKPSHVVKYAGEVTWSGGGATLAETVAGVLETDIVIASFHTLGTQGTILQGAYASAADTITFTLDAANTSNDAVISYQVLRAVA